MPMNTNVDTRGMKQVDPPAMRVVSAPALTAPVRPPYFISNFPIAGPNNSYAAANFAVSNIPFHPIVPPTPLNMAGAGINATATIAVVPKLPTPVPAPTIASVLVSTPTGYSFAFNEVRLALSSSLQISSYKIYRGPSNDSSQATVIQTFPHSVNGLSTPVQVTDPQPNRQPFINNNQCYFVSAVATNGRESTLTPAQAGLVPNTVSGFNPSGQLVSSFHSQPLNVSFTPLSSSTLSNDGSSTAITVAATQIQFGSGNVAYNSATVDRGGFGTSYVTAIDPQFSGGSALFLIAATNLFQTVVDSVLAFGKITTSSTSITSGGGASGGTTTGGAGVRGITL